MRKYIAIILALPLTAFAALPWEPIFRWIPPSEFADGSPLDPATDLQYYEIRCTGPQPVTLQVPPDADQVQTTRGTFTTGSYECTMVSVANDGRESAPSAPVFFDVPEPVPATIIDFSVD